MGLGLVDADLERRGVVLLEHAGRLDRFAELGWLGRITQDGGDLLEGGASIAQDRARRDAGVDDGGFDADGTRPSIQDYGDLRAQCFADDGGSGGADLGGAVGTGRGQRVWVGLKKGLCERMLRHTDPHRGQAIGCQTRERWRGWLDGDDQGQGTVAFLERVPKGLGELEGLFGKVSVGQRLLEPRCVDDEGVERGAVFEGVDRGDGGVLRGVSCEAIDGFCGNGHDAPLREAGTGFGDEIRHGKESGDQLFSKVSQASQAFNLSKESFEAKLVEKMCV